MNIKSTVNALFKEYAGYRKKDSNGCTGTLGETSLLSPARGLALAKRSPWHIHHSRPRAIPYRAPIRLPEGLPLVLLSESEARTQTRVVLSRG